MRKVVSKVQKNPEKRTQGVRSNKVSRLCYITELGTLSHPLPALVGNGIKLFGGW